MRVLGYAISLALAGVVTGCGGGGGGGGGGGFFPVVPSAPAPAPAPSPSAPPVADTTRPTVLAFVPAAGNDVPRTTEISATFSEGLRASTVTDSNVQISRSGAAVDGVLSYDATLHKVSFAPAQTLDLLATYTVTAGTGLQDLAGNGLAAERSWSFRTADGVWETPRQLDAERTAVSGNPVTAQDSQGNIVVVWSSQASSGWYEIRSATRTESGAWGGFRTLSVPGNRNALLPQVGFDRQGGGLAIWSQFDGSGVEIWSSRFLKDGGWQTPVRLDSGLDVGDASLAVGADGNGFAVWAKRVAPYGNPDAWAARFTVEGGWQAPVRLGSSANSGTYDKVEQPQVAIDAAGNAYALWVQRTSDAPVWAARYELGTGWQPAVSLGATRLGDPFAPRLAISGSGQVMALWNSFVYAGGPYRFDLWWSTLGAPGGTWTTPALLETDDAGDAMRQVLVADSTGSFHAVWQQYLSDYRSDLLYRRYTPGSGWSTATTVSTTNGTYWQNRMPSLVADRNGHLMLMWGAYQSGYGGDQEGTFARRYVSGEGWQATRRVGAAGASAAMFTSLAMRPNGTIAASWMEPSELRSDGPVSASVFR